MKKQPCRQTTTSILNDSVAPWIMLKYDVCFYVQNDHYLMSLQDNCSMVEVRERSWLQLIRRQTLSGSLWQDMNSSVLHGSQMRYMSIHLPDIYTLTFYLTTSCTGNKCWHWTVQNHPIWNSTFTLKTVKENAQENRKGGTTKIKSFFTNKM